MSKTAYFFKILDKRDSGGFNLTYSWPPIGEWTERLGFPLRMCHNGYHLLRPRDLGKFWRNWRYKFPRPSVYLVEAETAGMREENGSFFQDTTKVCVRRARLVKKLKFKGMPRHAFQNKRTIREWMAYNGIVLED